MAVALFLAASVARADDIGPGPGGRVDYCSLERKCSSSGRACGTGDTACQSEATLLGLEIRCEDRIGPKRLYVYCPPGESRDSKIVWLLLGVVFILVLVGFGCLRLGRAMVSNEKTDG